MKNSKKIMSLIIASALVMGLSACQSNTTGSAESTASEPSSAAVTEESAAAADSMLSGTVALGGSTSMESVIGYLKEQFTEDNSGVTISYAGVGSGGGIEGVSNGTYDIGLSSRDLKDEEKEKGLSATVLALDGIAVIVNSECAVDDLSLEEISAIYSNGITNWSEVGGDDL